MTPTLVLYRAATLAFRMVLSSDHRSPAPGAAPTVTISRGLGPFAAPFGTVTERGGGWYELAATAADLATLGPFLLHAEAASCDPADLLDWVALDAGDDPLDAGLAASLPFLMVATSDGVTPATGLSPPPAATIYWPGGTTTAVAAREIDHGWYAAPGIPPAGGTAEVTATATGAATAGTTFAITVAPASPAGGGTTPVPASGVYFAPAYFAHAYFFPFYFPGLTGVVAVPAIPPDEIEVFRDIAGRLAGLRTADGARVFDAVEWVETPDSVEATSDWAAYAVVWRIAGDEVDDAMSEAPDVMIRVTYGLLLQVNGLESAERAAALNRLVGLVNPQLNYTSLGGHTLPGLTRIRRDARKAGSQPQGSATLTGEFAILTADALMDGAYQD